MGPDDPQAREGAHEVGQHEGAGRRLVQGIVAADMDLEDEVVLGALEDGQQAPVIEREALEIGMELDAAQAARLHALQFVFPVHIGRMQGAEADDFLVFPLQLHGVIVGRDDLRGGRGRAEDDASVDAGGLFTLQKVFDGAVTTAVEMVDRVEVLHGLVGDLGMEGVGMDVEKHDGLGWLVGRKAASLFRRVPRGRGRTGAVCRPVGRRGAAVGAVPAPPVLVRSLLSPSRR